MPSSRKVKLSSREADLLACIPADGSRINTKQLVAAYYGRDVPTNGRMIITDRLGKIAQKLEAMQDKNRLRKSKRCGPAPIEYWLAKAS